jgi:hypothetical protein
VGFLRDAAELVAPAVEAALGALTLADEDQAAAALARQYARAIDEAMRAEMLACRALEETPADDVMSRAYIAELAAKLETKELLDRLGPKLLQVLESLGATPAARGRLKGGGSTNAAPSQLERLRQARGRPA